MSNIRKMKHAWSEFLLPWKDYQWFGQLDDPWWFDHASVAVHVWMLVGVDHEWLVLVVEHFALLVLGLGCWRWSTFLRLWIILFFIFIHLGFRGGARCRWGRSFPLIIAFMHLFRLDISNGHLLQSFINLIITYIVIANSISQLIITILPLGSH